MAMQILLMVGGFDVDRGAELTLVDVNINIQEGDMGLGGVPGVLFESFTYSIFFVSSLCLNDAHLQTQRC